MSAIGVAAVLLNVLTVLGLLLVMVLGSAMRHREAANKAAADAAFAKARDGADRSASAGSASAAFSSSGGSWAGSDTDSLDAGLSFLVDATAASPGLDVPTASVSKLPEGTPAQLAVPVDELDSTAVTLV
jgi:hypothetical protein